MKDSGLLAKGYSYYHWIYYDYEWHKDTKNIVYDKLIGYDPSEPSDSPYAVGSRSVMDEIKQISYEEAMETLAEQIIINLINKWQEQFKSQKEEWDKKPGRPAKLAETSFCLFNARYTLTPEDLGFDKDSFDSGFMESIQKELEKDLTAVGATEITSSGMPD